MLVDIDNRGNVSIMEISKIDTYVITEALIRLSVDSNISKDIQIRSKEMAVLINKENNGRLQRTPTI